MQLLLELRFHDYGEAVQSEIGNKDRNFCFTKKIDRGGKGGEREER